MALLDNLTADIYKAVQVVSRERTGLAQSVMMNSSEQVAAHDSYIDSMFAPSRTATDQTPQSNMPNAGAHGSTNALEKRRLKVDKLQGVSFPWSGEQVKHMTQTGGQSYENVVGAQIEQGIRAVANAVEADISDAIERGCGYGVGTAGTALFGSNTGLASDALEMLDRAGAPAGDRKLVFGHTASTAIRKLSEYRGETDVSDQGTLRTGRMAPLYGADVSVSAAIDQNRVPATAPNASQKINGAVAVGAESWTIDGGNGAIVDGGLVEAGGFLYGVKARAAAATTLNLKARTLVGIANDGDVDPVAAHVRNVAFHRNAIELAMRPVQADGDLADEDMVVTDPVSGMVFRVAVYGGFLRREIYVQGMWGTEVWQPEHVCAIVA